MPWSRRYSSSASSGVSVRARTSAAPSGHRPGQHDLLVVERLAAEQVARPVLPSTSTIRVDRPERAAARASAARDGRFAHAALPGHDDEAGCCEELRRIHGQPFGASVRKLPRGLACLGILLLSFGVLASAAAAQQPAPAPAPTTAPDDGLVTVIKVSG